MPSHFTFVLILASALYSVAALFAFALFFSPFAGANQIPMALALAVVVLTPYAFLFAAHRIGRDSLAESTTALAAFAAALIGGYVYFFSFDYNDGEYWVAYILTPAIQAPFVLAALGLVIWRRRHRNQDAT